MHRWAGKMNTLHARASVQICTGQSERCTGRAGVRSDFRSGFRVLKSEPASCMTNQHRRGCGCGSVVFVHIKGVNPSIRPSVTPRRDLPPRRLNVRPLRGCRPFLPVLLCWGEKNHRRLRACTDMPHYTVGELGGGYKDMPIGWLSARTSVAFELE